jgi:hypothetical protein
MHLPGLLLDQRAAAASKLTSAVVAAKATVAVAATAEAVNVTAAAVVSAEAAVCRRGCNPGSIL